MKSPRKPAKAATAPDTDTAPASPKAVGSSPGSGLQLGPQPSLPGSRLKKR